MDLYIVAEIKEQSIIEIPGRFPVFIVGKTYIEHLKVEDITVNYIKLSCSSDETFPEF